MRYSTGGCQRPELDDHRLEEGAGSDTGLELTVPPEIWVEIARQLCYHCCRSEFGNIAISDDLYDRDGHYQVLRSVCLVSRRFREIFQPFLYHWIAFELPYRLKDHYDCLLWTLTERPEFASCVKAACFYSNAKNSVGRAAVRTIWNLTPLPVLPNLEHLLWHSTLNPRGIFPAQEWPLKKLDMDSACCDDSFRTGSCKNVWSRGYLMANSTSMTSFTLRHLKGPKAFHVPNAKAFFYNVTKFHLVEPIITTVILSGILKQFVSLRHFQWTCVGMNYRRDPGLWRAHDEWGQAVLLPMRPGHVEVDGNYYWPYVADLLIALEPHYNTLEKLDIVAPQFYILKTEIDESSIEDTFQTYALSSLKQFKRLRSLKIGITSIYPCVLYHFFVGCRRKSRWIPKIPQTPKGGIHHYIYSTSLYGTGPPASLEELTLSEYEAFRTVPMIGKDLQDLVSAKAQHLPNLRKLTIACRLSKCFIPSDVFGTKQPLADVGVELIMENFKPVEAQDWPQRQTWDECYFGKPDRKNWASDQAVEMIAYGNTDINELENINGRVPKVNPAATLWKPYAGAEEFDFADLDSSSVDMNDSDYDQE